MASLTVSPIFLNFSFLPPQFSDVIPPISDRSDIFSLPNVRILNSSLEQLNFFYPFNFFFFHFSPFNTILRQNAGYFKKQIMPPNNVQTGLSCFEILCKLSERKNSLYVYFFSLLSCILSFAAMLISK